MEILQNVADRFTPMKSMKEVLQGFLTAIKVKPDSWRQQSALTQPLQDVFAQCEVAIPCHLQ